MLWLTVKCANGADPDFQVTMQVICDCSNHIILDVHSLDYHCWERRGFILFLAESLGWALLGLNYTFCFNQKTRFSMGLSLSGEERLFHELQITWRVFGCIFYLSTISWVLNVVMYCTCVFVNMLLCCDEDTPLIVPKRCQPASLGTRAGCEDHAWAVYLT